MIKWIDAEERVPDHGKAVLVDDGDVYTTAEYNIANKEFDVVFAYVHGCGCCGGDLHVIRWAEIND